MLKNKAYIGFIALYTKDDI